MSYRSLLGDRRFDVRRRFALNVLGGGRDETVPELKRNLKAVGAVESEDAKIQLVMLDDLEHFVDLVADEGIPVMRGTMPYEMCRTVTLPRWQHRGMMAMWVTLIFAMPDPFDWYRWLEAWGVL